MDEITIIFGATFAFLLLVALVALFTSWAARR